MTYTDVFSGDTISPAGTSLTKLDMTGNVTLYWPLEAEPNSPLASDIVQITSSTSAYAITLPDATRVSGGDRILFNNLSAYTITINDNDGTAVLVMPTSTQWTVYLSDNTTAAGTWKSYQLGATTSTANSATLAGYGIKAIGSTLNQKVTTSDFLYSFTASTADRAKFFNFSGSGAGVVVTPPVASSAGSDWFFYVRNSGDNSIAITPSTGTINTASSLTLQPLDSCMVLCDGTNYSTVGFGQDVEFAFDYVSIDVTGSSDYILSGAELNRVAYKFTGTLGADLSVIVPATVQQYWVYDATSVGPFTLSIKTAAQITHVQLLRGERAILYCDGTDVVPAYTATYSGSVDGGTF